MKKATEFKVIYWQFASDSIKYDFELFVRALSHGHGVFSYISIHSHMGTWEPKRDGNDTRQSWKDWIESLEVRLQEKMLVYANYANLILPELSQVAQTKPSASSLQILNQGPETTFVYKKLLAEYLDLDVPVNKNYEMYKNAAKSIAEEKMRNVSIW